MLTMVPEWKKSRSLYALDATVDGYPGGGVWLVSWEHMFEHELLLLFSSSEQHAFDQCGCLKGQEGWVDEGALGGDCVPGEATSTEEEAACHKRLLDEFLNHAHQGSSRTRSRMRAAPRSIRSLARS